MNKPKSTAGKQAILHLIIGLVVLVMLNIINQQFFLRFDLTQDKRFSISPATKNLLSKIDEPIYIEVFLEGEFPAGFLRLKKSIKETLDEFRVYSDNNITYKFTDPSISSDKKIRNQTYAQLARRGLQPTNLSTMENGNKIEKIIFPGAIINVRGQEVAVQFLKGNQVASPEERLNQSIEGVEYELAASLKRLTGQSNRKIAVLSGHGELNQTEFYDLGTTLKQYFDAKLVRLQDVNSLSEFEAIIVAKPDSFFTDKEKYKIDQYIVKGGKAIFFIDGLAMSMDSIKPEGVLALPYNLNLTDQFFRWGVRVNNDLLQDIVCAAERFETGYMGDKRYTQVLPWRYYPLINNFGQHPIVKNMDAVYTRFVSSIDTVGAPEIKKTPLLYTGQYSRIIPGPARVTLNDAKEEPRKELFNKSFIPVAMLLEGNFKSDFEYKINAEAKKRTGYQQVTDKAGKVLIVSDGDIAKNDFSKKQNTVLPLGWDKYAGIQFANKDFILNALNYMLDEEGVILAKSKDIKIRNLDKPRLDKEKNKWRVFNMVVPVSLILIFGLIKFSLRKKKYGKQV